MPIRSMINKYHVLVSLVWFLSTGLLRSFPLASQQQQLDKVIASIDNQILLQSELEREYQYYQAQERESVGLAHLKDQIFENLLLNKMILARAEIEQEIAMPEEIERELHHKMQYFIKQAGSEEKFIHYTGKAFQDFKEELRHVLKEQLTIERMRNKIVAGIMITPAEVRAYFQSLPVDALPYYPAEVELKQLVKLPKLSKEDKKAIIQHLQQLKLRIQNGEAFSELARQYSEDMGSASNGGEIGFWSIGELTPAYEAAILGAKLGEVIGPIETPLGFHLIQILDRQENRYNSRHILVKARPSEVSVEEACNFLQSIRALIIDKRITFEEAAILYSENIQEENVINYAGQGNRVPLDALPADIFLIVNQLNTGDVSSVDQFNIPTLGKAARLIYVKQKLPVHQANLQQDYEKIYKMALGHKKDLALKDWFKKNKEAMNVKIDPAYQHCIMLQ